MNIEIHAPEGGVAWTEADHTLPESVAQMISASWSEHTHRARKHDWDRFSAWCETEGRTPLPATAETLATYVGYLTSTLNRNGNPYAPSTIERVLSSIGGVHTWKKKDAPTTLAFKVLKTYREDREEEGFRTKRAAAVTVDELRRMAEAAGTEVIGVRDRMVMLLAFYLLARRSEVTRVRIGDVVFTPDGGMDVRLLRTKTDKNRSGQIIHIRPAGQGVCAVEAVKAWLEVMDSQGVTDGMLVRQVRSGEILGQVSDRLVDRVVKKLASRAGVDQQVSGHTLRRSPVTYMAEKGVPEARIARRGGWSGTGMVSTYVADARDQFDDPMEGLGVEQ